MVSRDLGHANAFLAEARRDVSFWWWLHRAAWSTCWGCSGLHTGAVEFTRIARLRATVVSGVPSVRATLASTDEMSYSGD